MTNLQSGLSFSTKRIETTPLYHNHFFFFFYKKESTFTYKTPYILHVPARHKSFRSKKSNLAPEVLTLSPPKYTILTDFSLAIHHFPPPLPNHRVDEVEMPWQNLRTRVDTKGLSAHSKNNTSEIFQMNPVPFLIALKESKFQKTQLTTHWGNFFPNLSSPFISTWTMCSVSSEVVSTVRFDHLPCRLRSCLSSQQGRMRTPCQDVVLGPVRKLSDKVSLCLIVMIYCWEILEAFTVFLDGIYIVEIIVQSVWNIFFLVFVYLI